MKIRQTLLVLALPLVVGSAHANLLSNGSFESMTAPVPPNATAMLAPGSGSLTDWQVDGQTIAWIDNSNAWGLSSQDGLAFLDLTALKPTAPYGLVKQTIATTAGSPYSLSFWFGTSTTYGVPASMLVSAGAASSTFTNSSVGTNTWTHYSLSFVGAPGASTIISFLGTVPSNTNYIGLDNVSVTAVPEPSEALMLLAGLGFIGAIAVRRNKFKKQS